MIDLRRLLTNSGVVEDLGKSSIGIFPSKLPHIKERFPINKRKKFIQGEVFVDFGPQKRGFGGFKVIPIQLERFFLGLVQGQKFSILEIVIMVFPNVYVLVSHLFNVFISTFLVQQTGALNGKKIRKKIINNKDRQNKKQWTKYRRTFLPRIDQKQN